MSQSGWHRFHLVDGQTQCLPIVHMTPYVKNMVHLNAVEEQALN